MIFVFLRIFNKERRECLQNEDKEKSFQTVVKRFRLSFHKRRLKWKKSSFLKNVEKTFCRNFS
jgi:hypothetical protein